MIPSLNELLRKRQGLESHSARRGESAVWNLFKRLPCAIFLQPFSISRLSTDTLCTSSRHPICPGSQRMWCLWSTVVVQWWDRRSSRWDRLQTTLHPHPDPTPTIATHLNVLFTQTRQALAAILNDLDRKDHFALITFDSEIITWEDTLVKATQKNVSRAIKYVGRISSRGGQRKAFCWTFYTPPHFLFTHCCLCRVQIITVRLVRLFFLTGSLSHHRATTFWVLWNKSNWNLLTTYYFKNVHPFLEFYGTDNLSRFCFSFSHWLEWGPTEGSGDAPRGKKQRQTHR